MADDAKKTADEIAAEQEKESVEAIQGLPEDKFQARLAAKRANIAKLKKDLAHYIREAQGALDEGDYKVAQDIAGGIPGTRILITMEESIVNKLEHIPRPPQGGRKKSRRAPKARRGRTQKRRT